MTAPLRPGSTKQYLNDKWIVVPSGSFDPTAPSLAILTGGTALDVTKMFFASMARPGQSTNLVKSPKRVGDAEVYEQVGETAVTLGEMRYSYSQQAATGDLLIKAFEKLVEGFTGFLCNRLHLPRDTDLATGQFITSYPFAAGPQLEVPEGDAEAAEGAITQTFAQTGPKSLKKVITT